MVKENLVSYFPGGVYNGFVDIAGTIMNPAICSSSTVNLSAKYNFNLICLKSNTFTYRTKYYWRYL